MILVIAVIGALIFPALLIGVFFVEELKVIRKEGLKATNLLSLLFAILLCAYLTLNALLREFAGYLQMTWKK